MRPVDTSGAKPRVLLTGASGYLGGHVLRELRRRGWATSALLRADSRDHEAKARWIEEQGAEVVEGDLRSGKDLGRALRGATHLVHGAAVLGNWSRQNNDQFHVNVDGTAALMRVALQRKLERVVHVSSIAAIGATREPRPMDEDEVWSWSDRPKLHYAKTKREGEERCLHALRNGLPVVVVNPTAMLGRSARGGDLRGLCAQAQQGGSRRLMKGGASFAHVVDVARSVVAALEQGAVGERYVLGGANATWTEFHACAARVNGAPCRLSTWPTWVGRALEGGAIVLDGLGLSRPPWAPERYRVWGWYGFADSSKAAATLGHAVPSLEALLQRVYGEPSSAGRGAGRPQRVEPA